MNWRAGLQMALAAIVVLAIIGVGLLVGLVFGADWLILSMPLAIVLIVFLAGATA